jgi:Domain of unknown function (DUF4337)
MLRVIASVLTLLPSISDHERNSASAIRLDDCNAKGAMTKQIDEWQKTAARYRSEPETREGTTELAERAMEAEHERDTALARYHNYEIALAAFQIGIVHRSAAIITGMLLLAWAAGGAAIFGIAFTTLGLFASCASSCLAARVRRSQAWQSAAASPLIQPQGKALSGAGFA